MTIRFAAAWGGSASVIVHPLRVSVLLNAANDNRTVAAVPVGLTRLNRSRLDLSQEAQLLTDTLRHFAAHGLSAAAAARSHAIAAQTAGDIATKDHWLAICRKLDRRMADACERNLMTED